MTGDFETVRARYLELKGYRVVRFTNVDIMKNLEGALQALEEALTPPLPNPLP